MTLHRLIAVDFRQSVAIVYPFKLLNSLNCLCFANLYNLFVYSGIKIMFQLYYVR